MAVCTTVFIKIVAYVKYFDYFCRAKVAAPAKKTLKNGLRPLNSKKAAFQSAE